MDSTSESNSADKLDSLARLREYVREHKKLQPQLEKVVDDDETKDRNVVSSILTDDLNLSSASSSSDSNSNSKTNSKRLSNAAKRFMDNEDVSVSSSSSSSMSSVRDYDNDYISYSDGRRPSFFIESSKVSLSSDEEAEEASPLSDLVEHILAGRRLATDWDSGLSLPSIANEYGASLPSIELEDENNDDVPRERANANGPSLDFIPLVIEGGLHFPHRPLRVMECQICYEKDYLRRRVCCDFQICNTCLGIYLSGKVTDGKAQIECANDRCNALMFKDEIVYRLPISLREKFARYLINANKDPHEKTCPSCSLPYNIDPDVLKVRKKKLKHGVRVTCTNCRLLWCFLCQAPYHSNLTCKKYKNEDQMVKRWAKGKTVDGQANAQRCPKCKIFVQKMKGCDHMKCTQCDTNFCYKCGDRYLSVKFFGSHWNRFSLFGCKYSLLPEKTALRRLIRGSHFAARVFAAVVLAALGVAAGAVVVAGSVVILPGYGIFLLRRRMWAARQRKKLDRVKLRAIALVEKQRATMLLEQQNGNLETVVEESETETWEQTSNSQQIQVIVHQQEEDALMMGGSNKDSDIIVNKYASEDSDRTASYSVSNANNMTIDDYVKICDFGEAYDVGKCTKSVKNVMSSTKEKGKMEETADSGVICEDGDVDFDKKEVQISKSVCEDASSCEKEVVIEEGRKQSESDLNPSSCRLDNGDFVDAVLSDEENYEIYETVDNHVCVPDVQSNTHSLSYSLGEKIIKKSKVLKMDIDSKITSPDKANGEDGGKGCFGNIFNVGKRAPALSTTNNNLNDEDVMKTYKEKTCSGDVKKAAAWEKCRESKVEVELSWNNKSSVVDIDTDSNLTNDLSLIAHKSSSFSSGSVNEHCVAGVDEVDERRDDSDCRSPDHLLQQHFDCDTSFISEDCVDAGCDQKLESDASVARCNSNHDKGKHITKIQVGITDIRRRPSLVSEPDLDQICQISIETHL